MNSRRILATSILAALSFGSLALCLAAEPGNAGAGAKELVGEARQFQELLSKGMLAAIFIIFGAGLGSCLTPCVYPLIPITISVIGARQAKTRLKALSYAATYVLGMVIMYAILGLVAALAGKVFGFTLQNPYVMAVIVLFCLIMAAGMFGAFEIRLPASLQNKLGGSRGSGYMAVFFMGLIAGIIAAPCTAPILGYLLAYISQTRDALLGLLFMVIYALGIGLPFLVLGTFSEWLTHLPRSGAWMITVKRVFGMAMLIIALYYLQFALPKLVHGAVSGTFLVFFGIYGAVIWRPEYEQPRHDRVARYGAVVAFAAGLLLFCTWSTELWSHIFKEKERAGSLVTWRWDAPMAIRHAKEGRRPAIVDFWATWCAHCNKLDRTTFAAQAVYKESRRFTMIKVDCTKESRLTRKLRKRFRALSLPTIAFIDPSGMVRHDLKVTGYLGPRKFLKIMKRLPPAKPRRKRP